MFLPALRENRCGLQKAVGVDIDLQAHRALDAHPRQPAAQYRLQIDLAPGLDEKPAAVAAAQHRERRRRRTERARARAAKSAASASSALTISAASRPKGGNPALRRAAASASRNRSRSLAASAFITGWSGIQVWISTRPLCSARPARPPTWCSS